MKYLLYLLITFGVTGCVTYKLPDAKLDPEEVCGQSECQPGNLGRVFQFDKNPYSPDLTASTSPKDIAYSVLGHTVKMKDKSGSRFTVCAADGVSNPFNQSDVKPKRLGISGRKIEYARNASLNIDITPTISATLKELTKYIDISSYISELEAKLKVGYESIDKADSTLVGTYFEYGLSDNVIKTLHTSSYQSCNSYLTDKNKALITAVGFIEYSTSVNSSNYSKFIGEINALFTAKGINLDVTPIINKEVTKTLKASTENGYQIIVLRKAQPDWIE
jgi:hypothetical protein